MKKKKLILPALAVTGLLLGGLFWTGKVSARGGSFPEPVVDKLVEKFGLNREELTGAFEEVRQERQVQMQAQREARLSEAVTAGVITEEQKQMLLAREAQMEQKREQERQEMATWRQESGIDFEALSEYLGGGHRGFGLGPGFDKF